uniref:Protease inhibitor n=1 Tax=Locusta migratoria migratorioides TaxID=7005 RepID=Q8WQ21_LOCMI|nr:pacifastin-related serine protease inhibitor precursor [Locusta migratoria migratorioides]
MNVAVSVLALLLVAVGCSAEFEKECTPGETKKLDCNTCFCTKAGIWGCTLMACRTINIELTPGQNATRVRRSEEQCTPGTTFKKDCNTCSCGNDGTAAVCTLKACRELTTDQAGSRARRSASHCTPNTTFQKDCNTCTCNKDGTAAVCTLKACLKRSTREVSCTPGATYKEDCNICRCRSDGKSGACTKKSCPVVED